MDGNIRPGQLAAELNSSTKVFRNEVRSLSHSKGGIDASPETHSDELMWFHLDALGSGSGVIAPKGNVNVLEGVHGLAQVSPPGEDQFCRPGQGWEIYVD